MNKILLLPPICEESQLQKNRKYAEKLFDSAVKGKTPLTTKLSNSSEIVKETFTIDDMTNVLNEYDTHLSRCYEHPAQEKFEYSFSHLLSNPNFLLLAYSKLLSRGEVASGIDGVPTKNITLGGIRKLAKELGDNSYKPNVVRRVYIPKPGKPGQLRPLGVTSTRDKVVQQGIKMLIEPIFEKIFANNSYGFRPNRSCHTCLKSIDLHWKRITWFIEADIVQAFDKVHHRILERSIAKRLKDKKIIHIINKMVKVGYINWENLSESKLEANIGTPQGSIISPLLCNIYLHSFDEFMNNTLLPIFNVGRIDKVNEKYKEMSRITGPVWGPAFEYIKSITPKVSSRDIRKNLSNIRKIERIHDDIPYYALDENHRRLKYVRYADDFVLGFVGPKSEALKILQLIAHYLENELEFQIHPSKSGIVHHSKGVIFLGYHLHGNYEAKNTLNRDADGNILQRKRSNWIKFGIPLHKIFKRYADKGFFQKARKGKQIKLVARRMDKWLFLTSDKEVVKRFNAVARGIAEYYKGSKYPSVLNEFWWTLKRSLALTLAHRHKMKSAKKAYQKWGPNLQVDPDNRWVTPEINGGKWSSGYAVQGNLTKLTNWQPSGGSFPKTLGSILTARELNCSIPGCPNRAEDWHHIHHRKRSKKQDKSLALASKQIPICKAHHNIIHNGKYDGPSLRKLPGYTADSVSDAFKNEVKIQ